MPRNSLRCACLLLLWVGFWTGVGAQNANPLPSQTTSHSGTPKSSNHVVKLTPEQDRGLRLLKRAEAEAAGLEPNMRAYVLWRIAVGYEKIDRSRSDRMLNQAFLATQAMEQGPDEESACWSSATCRTKSWLQSDLLEAIMQRSPEKAEQLLPSADPVPRQTATAALAELYVKRKDLVHAQELLTRLADSKDYPFGIATKVLLALPKDSPEKVTIFSQCMTNFQQYGSSATPNFDDFGTLVVRFAQRLPPDIALSAVDLVLAQAKNADEKQKMRLSFGTGKGQVGFNSIYQLRLFQMLPVLEELDKDRAESLLRENQDTKSLLAAYPKGMQSLDPGHYQEGGASSDAGDTGGIYSTRYSCGEGPSNAAESLKEQAADKISRRLNAIPAEVAQNPKQALTDALNLPQVSAQAWFASPRVQALGMVADGTVEKNPGITRSALEELRKNLDSARPFEQGRQLARATRLYLKMGDIADAKKTLQELLKSADRTYAVDTNADDPNQAFKGQWPSTALWQAGVQLGARISPVLAEQMGAAVSDPEIGAAVRVAYANALLGVPLESIEVEQRHKDAQTSSTVTEF